MWQKQGRCAERSKLWIVHVVKYSKYGDKNLSRAFFWCISISSNGLRWVISPFLMHVEMIKLLITKKYQVLRSHSICVITYHMTLKISSGNRSQLQTITGFSPRPVLWVSVRPPILQCSIRARTHRVGLPSLSGLERKLPRDKDGEGFL